MQKPTGTARNFPSSVYGSKQQNVGHATSKSAGVIDEWNVVDLVLTKVPHYGQVDDYSMTSHYSLEQSVFQ
jgi:hypothetical protein